MLVVAGDVDPAQVNLWVERYFGSIPKPAAAIPRVTIVEPKQTAQRHIVYAKADVPLPAVRFVYHVPSARDADSPALDVLASILGDGKSSRLYQGLVYQAQAASEVVAANDERQQPGIFWVGATAASAASAPKLKPLLSAQVAAIVKSGPSEDEVAKAKTVLLASLVRQRQMIDEVALSLAYTAVLYGDPAFVNEIPRRLSAVTAADVQRVARTYLTTANQTVIDYTTAAAK